MKRFLMISLLTMTGLTLQAQTKSYNLSVKYNFQLENSAVNEYAKGMGMYISRPQVRKTKDNKTTAKWYATNNSWIKDYCEVENPPIEKDILKIFPEMINLPQGEHSYMPMSWRLTAEGNETVLHCYFIMPADEITDMWLASEETCLVDQETGAQYRIRRTEPETYRKHFTIRAK